MTRRKKPERVGRQRGSYGNREAMEALLSPEDLERIKESCLASGVDPKLWHRCDAIAPGWEMICVTRRAKQLRELLKMGRNAADLTAAFELGLDDQTIRSRRRRWQKQIDKRLAEDRLWSV